MAQADVRTIKAQLKKGELNNIYYLLLNLIKNIKFKFKNNKLK